MTQNFNCQNSHAQKFIVKLVQNNCQTYPPQLPELSKKVTHIIVAVKFPNLLSSTHAFLWSRTRPGLLCVCKRANSLCSTHALIMPCNPLPSSVLQVLGESELDLWIVTSSANTCTPQQIKRLKLGCSILSGTVKCH